VDVDAVKNLPVVRWPAEILSCLLALSDVLAVQEARPNSGEPRTDHNKERYRVELRTLVPLFPRQCTPAGLTRSGLQHFR